MRYSSFFKLKLQFSKSYFAEQERCGELQLEYNLRKDSAIDVGWFDLVGNDVRKEWQKVGELSKDQAMLEFVRLLDIVCPAYRPHMKERQAIEAPKIVLGEAKVQKLVNSVNGGADSKEVLQRYQQQREQIQEALNKQTYHQFLAYAQQTHPGEPPKQEQLIKQLQEQHYNQYMAQVYAQQVQAQAVNLEGGQCPVLQLNGSESSDSEVGVKPADAYLQQGLERPPPKDRVHKVDENGEEEEDKDSDVSDEEATDDAPSNPKIAPASLWNSKNIVEFKNTIRKEGPEGILKVGHGETVTVRVPTHEEGKSLFWEFATDYYDIGFGVYFEWTIAESNQVTVHISESSDEELDEEAEGSGAGAASNDVEGGAGNVGHRKPRDPNKPLVDEVIPVFRRDCHEEVFAGSHEYPGRGVYLLKFDNSFSLWRSKTLYYRVFYSK